MNPEASPEASDGIKSVESEQALAERFDRAMAFFIGKTASQKAWRPIPELGTYLYKPEDDNSRYSPSIYYEPQRIYVRRSHLEPSYQKFEKAKQALAEIEGLIEKISRPE